MGKRIAAVLFAALAGIAVFAPVTPVHAEDSVELGDVGCAADCLAKQIDCNEGCGENMSCVVKCSADALKCQERCH